jgi:hypothetical protein
MPPPGGGGIGAAGGFKKGGIIGATKMDRMEKGEPFGGKAKPFGKKPMKFAKGGAVHSGSGGGDTKARHKSQGPFK